MAFEAFCIVEIMGHQVIAGKVSEETHFGSPLMRVDVPKSSKREGFTVYYGGGAIYKITPTTEEIVAAFVEKQDPEPVKPYMLALPTMSGEVELLDEFRGYDPDNDDEGYGDYEDDDDDFEDYDAQYEPDDEDEADHIVTSQELDDLSAQEKGLEDADQLKSATAVAESIASDQTPGEILF